jgi:hypothetical protein
LVKDVPYVAAGRIVKRGILVMPLKLAGDVTVKPDNHVAHFIGEFPCRADGTLIDTIGNESNGRTKLGEGVEIDQTFSAKPMPSGAYDNYYDKVTQYVTILSGYAQKIEPGVNGEDLPASRGRRRRRDGVQVYRHRLNPGRNRRGHGEARGSEKIAIVGLGGTGSYVWILSRRRRCARYTCSTATNSCSTTLSVAGRAVARRARLDSRRRRRI